MDGPEDSILDDEPVRAWHEYGLCFSVFVPDHQPKPDTWDPDVAKFDDKSRVNPYYSQAWR